MADTLTFEDATKPDSLTFEDAQEAFKKEVGFKDLSAGQPLKLVTPGKPIQTGDVLRAAPPRSLLPTDLLPAVRLVGGEAVPGKQGDTHPDVIERHDIPAQDIDQRGFLAPNGEFLDREAAAQATGLKTKFEPGRLHSTDLKQPEVGVALPPGWKPKITDEQRRGYDPSLLMVPGAGVAGTELTTALAGGAVKALEAIPKTIGGVVATALNLINPTTWLPEKERERLAVTFGDARTPKEQVAAQMFQAGKPLYIPEGTALDPESNDLQRLLSRWSTPEALGMLPAGMTKTGAALLLTTMVPGIVDTAKRLAAGDISETEKRDRMNDLFALGILWAAGRSGKPDTGEAGLERRSAVPADLREQQLDILAQARKAKSPEWRAVMGGIDPEVSGTTYEKAVEFAKSIGLDESHVVKPAKPQAAAAPEPVKPEAPPETELSGYIGALMKGEVPKGAGGSTTAGAWQIGGTLASLDQAEQVAKAHDFIRGKQNEARAAKNLDELQRWAITQFPREALEAAFKFGSAETAHADPPLNWRRNPDVAKWIVDNAARIGWDKKAPRDLQEVAASLKKPEPEKPVAKGAAFEPVSTPVEAKQVKGNYDVAEAGQLVTSGQADFDQSLQPRDRSRQASIEQINTIEREMNPARLGESLTSDLGAPFVNEKDHVLSGNARVMALRLHYDRQRDLYKHWLLEHAREFGLDPEAIRAMERPVLIRRVTDYGGMTQQEFARLSNEQQVAGMGEGERARADAMWLDQNRNILDLFNPSEEGDLMAASNRPFLNAFVNGVGDKESLLTAEGFNEKALTARVKNALLGVVLGHEQSKTISTLVESADTLHLSNAVNGVMRAVPRLMKFRGTDYDQTPHLGQALRDLITIRRSGQKVEDFLASKSLFGDEGRTAESDAILYALAKAKSGKAVTEAFMRYSQMAGQALIDAQSGGLLGEKPKTPAEIWRIINENKAAPTQPTLPPAKPAAPAAKPVEPPSPTPVPGAQPGPGPAAAPSPAKPIIDKGRADAIRERLKGKLGKPPEEMALEDVIGEALEARASLDPSIFSDAVQLGSYYIQSGLHKFDAWAAQMRSDFGEAIEPYLKSVYETARRTIEAPVGQAGGGAPGLQPGLLPPNARIVHARGDQTAKADESILPPETLQHLDPHQRQGAATNLKSLEERGGALNADGTGVGKTREGLTAAHYWAKKGFKVLYVTKAEAIKPNWKKGTFGGSLFHDAGIMGIKIRLAKDAVVQPGEIGVTTYENAKSVEHRADNNTVIIWDESHALKNDSQRGRAGDRAGNKAHAVLFMSATPADKPEHIYYLKRIGIMEGKSTAEQLRDLGMVEVEYPYTDPKTGERKTAKKWAPNQNISEEERNQRFTALFDRMTEKGAMIKREISMQGVHVQVLKVALPPEAHDLQQEILRFFDAETVEDLKGIKKAIALMHMRRQQEPFKIASTVMLAQRELEAGRQVMVFVSRVNESEVGKWVKVVGPGGITERVRQVLMSSEGTAKALRAAFHEAGIHDIAEIHGEADQPGLEALADFNAGKKRVCIATIESGGTGINADDIVGNRPRTMIVVTAPFDAVGNVQAAGRIWRLKTLSGANIFYLFADTDVDDWNADIIGTKMATLGAVVQGQVRRLDVANPDFVTTDDFGAAIKKKGYEPAPVGPSGMPQLAWEPYTSKKGEGLFSAPATGQFWQWYKAGNAPKLKAMGAWVGRGADGKLRVFARAIPEAQPPPASDPTKGAGGETALEARHGTATGLPPGIDDGGPNFAVELLEASRRLDTLVRSRTTLPPGVLGRYVLARAAIAQADRIEVGDIQNQATVAHEEGHDMDALIFPGQFPGHSQKSLAARIGHADKKVLTAELIAVSELMRGPITGSRGHVTYRKRATELIADWYSLYVHDPARARAMAPEWTRGFEAELHRHPDAEQVVRELHARSVTPVSPIPPGVGGAPTGAPTGMPGALPARQVTPTPREAQAALAAENLVKGEIRRYEAEVQKARIRAENWRREVPKAQDRNDVGAFVEGIGNLEIPGDTRVDVIARMTPAKNELAKTYRFQIELQRQRINMYLKDLGTGEYLAFLEDYLPHFYVNSRTPAGQQAMARFIKNSPNAKARKIPTLREAVEYGFVPITQDPATLYELHARINWRVATNRRFLAQLKQVTTSAGEPVIVPSGQNPGNWPVSNNPLIQRVYAHQTAGGTLLWKGGAAIHPDVWHAVRQIIESPTRSDMARLYDAVNSFTRANAFAFSLFHDITLRSASLGAEATMLNPLRGLFRLFEKDPVSGELKLFQGTRGAGKALLRDEEAVADAALHGLKFAWTESESYQHAARRTLEHLAVRLKDIPFLGQTAKLARNLQRARQEGLWRNTHDAFKILAYHDLVNKALSGAPAGTDPKAVKERIASMLNDCFGGQEWQTKFWLSPQVRLNMARFFLAPDWTLSTLRSVPFLSDVASATRGQAARVTGRGPEATPKEGWKGNIGRGRFWMAELAALALATIAAQYAIYRLLGKKEKGDQPWVWDNELGQNRRIDVTPIMRGLPWAKPDDPTRYYVNLGKRPEEILHWFVHPEQNIQSKLARPLIESIRQVTGMEGEFKAEWARSHETFVESLPARLKSAGREAVPFVFAGNQFALSVPYRKGMTRYKAEQAFESAYELVAEPNRVRAALRGDFSGNMDRLLSDIREAAQRNGVNVEAAESRGRSAVRSVHYRAYFKAFQKGDLKTMERETDALDRLGIGPLKIQHNINLREKLEPAAP